MKTGLPNLTFCVTFSQLLLSNISLFTALVTADFVFFFLIIITTPASYPAPPRPTPMCLPLPTILSLIQVTVMGHHCAPKAGFGTA